MKGFGKFSLNFLITLFGWFVAVTGSNNNKTAFTTSYSHSQKNLLIDTGQK